MNGEWGCIRREGRRRGRRRRGRNDACDHRRDREINELVLKVEKVLKALIETNDVFLLLLLKEEILGTMDKGQTDVLELRSETHNVCGDISRKAAVIGEFSDGNEELFGRWDKLVCKTLLFTHVDLLIVLIVIDRDTGARDDVMDPLSKLFAVGLVNGDVLLLLV